MDIFRRKENKMTKAYIGGPPIWNVRTLTVVKDKLKNGSEYLKIRINPKGDLYSDVEFNLWPEGDTFHELDLSTVPKLYKEEEK
jgi:hypothetical protein